MPARDLTLAELVREVERMGGDPEVTVIEIGADRVLADDEEYDVYREGGEIVVRFWLEDEDDEGWDSLASVTGVTDAAS